MSDGKLKSAPLAYENPAFLNSPDGRMFRILSEYTEPLARFRREQIQDTVVFFGSARFRSQAGANHNLAEAGKRSWSRARTGEKKGAGLGGYGALLRRRPPPGLPAD